MRRRVNQANANDFIMKSGRYQALAVTAGDSPPVVLYVDRNTPALMPSGPVQAGKTCTFVGRLQSTGRFKTDTGATLQRAVRLWGSSYELMDR